MGKRFGATLADTESRRFIQGFVLSSLLHQEPRYFLSGRSSFLGRAWYAATRVLVTKGDSGLSEFNSSELLGALATSSLQNAYYPSRSRTLDGTMSRFTGALGSDAASNLLHEFAPDLKRIFRRHAPKTDQGNRAEDPDPRRVQTLNARKSAAASANLAWSVMARGTSYCQSHESEVHPPGHHSVCSDSAHSRLSPFRPVCSVQATASLPRLASFCAEWLRGN